MQHFFFSTIFFASALFLSACAPKTAAVHSVADVKKMEEVETQVKVLENRLDHVMDEMNIMRDRMETIIIKSQQKDYDLPSNQDVAKSVVLKKEDNTNFLGVGAMEVNSKENFTLTNADLRRRSLEKKKITASTVKKPVVSEKDKAINHYNSAYKLYQVGEYKTARKSFLDFLHDYPKHIYADNALFWLAESYYNESDCDRALDYYNRVLSDYPNENKVPESLYKKTSCLIKTSQEDEAKKSLLSLIKTYPAHPITEKAKKKFLSKLIN